jgi:hypothetical protein
MIQTQLDPIECADEGRGGKEISSEFVVAGGDAPPILDTTEEVFDFCAAADRNASNNRPV